MSKKHRPPKSLVTTAHAPEVHTVPTNPPTPQVQTIEMVRSGPLPIPAEMAEYEQIVPGSANRLIRQVEIEGEHRRSMEAREQWMQFSLTALSNLIAAALVVAGAIYGVQQIQAGKDIQGYVLMLSPLATVIIAMLVKKKNGK